MPDKSPAVSLFPPSILSHDEVRALLAHTAVVVGPGETLILRGKDWTPNQVRELQVAVDDMREYYSLPFQTIVLPGDELAVARLPYGLLSPIPPVPPDEPAHGAPRPEPRRWQYHVGGCCGAPKDDGTCGCGPRAVPGDA